MFAKAIVLLLSVTIESALCCKQGWFGEDCKLQCHCDQDSTCLQSGECSPRCAQHWFGEKCQYASMPYIPLHSSGTIIQWLDDSQDSQCSIGKPEPITLRLEKPLLLTFLRFTFADRGHQNFVRISYRHAGNTTVLTCPQDSFAEITTTVFDFWCVTQKPVDVIQLGAAALEGLCSVRISRGRNLALVMDAQQSSQFYGWLAKQAVDGNIAPSNANDDTLRKICSHTKRETKGAPWWKLAFDMSIEPVQFVVYGRIELNNTFDNDKRLRGFKFQAFNPQGGKVFSFTERKEELERVHTINPSTAFTEPIKVIKVISATQFLTLCEVRAYGEVHCLPDRYGFKCEKTCNCGQQSLAPGGRNCYINSGRCPGGCLEGSTREDCKSTKDTKACAEGTWGPNCRMKCTPHCKGEPALCDPFSGACAQGCKTGYMPPTCETECVEHTYGQDCSQSCSRQCAGEDFRCHHVTGHCTLGCSFGYKPPLCVEECPKGTFGASCLNCSEYCADTSDDENACDHYSGICLHGCEPGYAPHTCAQECPAKKYGQDCLERCSENCLNLACHHVTGLCIDCIPGYRGMLCEEECLDGRWGSNCSQECSKDCKNRLCDKETGDCLECATGRIPPHCHDPNSSEMGLAGLFAASKVLVISMLTMLLLAVCLFACIHSFLSTTGAGRSSKHQSGENEPNVLADTHPASLLRGGLGPGGAVDAKDPRLAALASTIRLITELTEMDPDFLDDPAVMAAADPEGAGAKQTGKTEIPGS